ncbi:MAG TPA: hypothetical protein VKR57_13820 [Terriglobales bacterium]|jgi:hypothetical protein|nr:hypothetical protein [Terriglobales bacterium]
MKRLARFATVLVSCLREIFDESAYLRFLRTHRMSSSPEAYAEFCEERAAVSARRPRCC